METRARVVHHIFFVTIFAILMYATYLTYSTLIKDGPGRKYNDDCTDAEKLWRQEQRGTIASIICSVTMGTLNVLVDEYGKVNAATSTALIGLIFGGTLGFVMDNSIGSDTGWMLWNEKSPLSSWKYGLGKLISASYIRFAVTVLLDVFISLIIFKPMYNIVCELPFFRDGHQSLANGVVSTIIGMLTFQAYANVTRFSWAYPSTDSQTSSRWIGSGTMQLAVSIAAASFLAADTKAIRDESGINTPKVKLVFVICSFILLTILSKTGQIAPSLNVDVVPDNVFKVTSSRDLAIGDIVEMEFLKDVQGGNLPGGTYEVIESYETLPTASVHRVRRTSPTFKYLFSKNPTRDDVEKRGFVGGMYIIFLAILTSGLTVLGTSKASTNTKNKIFIYFICFSILSAMPAIC